MNSLKITRLAAADQSAIMRHISFLNAERGAVSLNAVLPVSGFAVEVRRDGEWKFTPATIREAHAVTALMGA